MFKHNDNTELLDAYGNYLLDLLHNNKRGWILLCLKQNTESYFNNPYN